MNEEVKVSLIVPVYNAGQFLFQCIDALLNQSLRSLEVIIVNDGSTDHSLDIVKTFQEKDTRVKLVDIANAGVSNARNKGLELATGAYVGFVDADDWVEKNMFASLADLMEKNDADLAICNVTVHENGKSPEQRLKLTDDVVKLSAEKKLVLNDFFDFKYDYANWNKLYRRSIIVENQLKFNTQMKIWEDLLFNLSYVHFAEKVCVLNQPLYHYRVHENSAMGKAENLLVSQYNLLFLSYRAFCNAHDFSNEFSAFNYKMADGVYNNLYPNISKRMTADLSFIRTVKLKSELLSNFEFGIFLFDLQKYNGYQKFKKRLLMKGYFRLFSILDSIRNLIFN